MRSSLGYLVLLSTTTAAAAPDPDAPSAAPAPPPSIPIAPPMLPSTAPGTRAASPPPGWAAPPRQPPRIEKPPSAIVPLLIGTGFGAAGIYIGGRLAIAAVDEQDLSSISAIALGALAGGSIAVTVGVMATAGDDAHESSIAATWGGSVLGGVAGSIIAFGASNDLTAGLLIAGGGASLGAWLGHELSRRRSAPPSPVQLAPLVTTHTTGLALGGNF